MKALFLQTFFCGLYCILLLSACKSSEAPSRDSLPDEIDDKIAATYDMNLHKLTHLVCDPFNDDSTESQTDNQTDKPMDLGVKASLFWLGANDPHYSRVSDYIEFGKASQETLFFSKIDVPTRKFDLGFPKETGELLKNDLEQDLIEYFAMRFDGEIQLGPENEVGTYEFAILSDDGTVFRVGSETDVDTGSVSEPQAMIEIIDNDGNHPTRMGCGFEARVEMTSEKRLPFQLDYYQGPRNHISLVLMWRKVNAETPLDPLCGVQGNRKYFDYDNKSEPQQAYFDLLERGWMPLQSSNFAIKEQDSHNPCHSGDKPLITDFNVEEDFDGGLRVTWKTDVHATSQVRVVNRQTDEETLTESDNFLRRDHFVRIFPPKNTPLLIQAVSVSDTMGKALSDVLTFIWE